jgi:hypothetical protein
MQGIFLAPGILILSIIKYKLTEQIIIARLLFQPLDNLDKNQVFQMRIKFIQNLI